MLCVLSSMDCKGQQTSAARIQLLKQRQVYLPRLPAESSHDCHSKQNMLKGAQKTLFEADPVQVRIWDPGIMQTASSALEAQEQPKPFDSFCRGFHKYQSHNLASDYVGAHIALAGVRQHWHASCV